MKKVFDWLRALVKHNLFQTIAVVVAIGALYFLGCDSTTKSLIDPERKVTRVEFANEYDQIVGRIEAEIASLDSKFDLGQADLDRQDAIKVRLAEIGMAAIEGETLNPVGIATGLIALLGIGAVVDNRMKDRVIATRTSDIKRLAEDSVT